MATKFCQHCAAKLPWDATACDQCGRATLVSPNRKSGRLAGWLVTGIGIAIIVGVGSIFNSNDPHRVAPSSVDASSQGDASPAPSDATENKHAAPQQQLDFLGRVETYRADYLNANTDLVREKVYDDEGGEFCQFMNGIKVVHGWVGEVENVRSDYVAIIDLAQSDKYRPRVLAMLDLGNGEDARAKAPMMRRGDIIKFSGRVKPGIVEPDCKNLFENIRGYRMTLSARFDGEEWSNVPIRVNLQDADVSHPLASE